MLEPAMAERLARIGLGHVTREWPHGLSHVLEGHEDVLAPRTLHPVFYGSFDWHSCVHGYWMLAVLLRRFPELAAAGAIRALFEARLTEAGVAGECAYFRRPAARGFERPYGWAWLLALQHALRGTVWAERLRPLAGIVAERFRGFLPGSLYPVRVGTHFNTAFALTVAAGFADAEDSALAGLFREKALDWYGGDAGCQAWEPSQDEFLSPALMEAACMRRLMAPGAFDDWFGRFLPELGAGEPATLFVPAVVGDRSDGKIAHLDGLNLSRAWCWREIGGLLGERVVAMHVAASIEHVSGEYMGEHWLASFAVLALLPGALA